MTSVAPGFPGRIRSALLLCALVMTGAGTATAAVFGYPGAAPCDTTLQACLDSTSAGDVVEIATDGPIDERILIRSGITLRAAEGFSPVVGRPGERGQDFQPCEFDRDAAAAQRVQIEGLTFRNVRILCTLAFSQGHTVIYRNNVIENSVGSTATRGLSFDFRIGATGIMERNRISTPGYPIEARLRGTSAQTVRITGNQLSTGDSALSATGIDVSIFSPSPAALRRVTVESNLLVGVAGCNCGGAVGIALYVDGEIPVAAKVNGNTLDSIGSTGISLVTVRGADLDVALRNNTVSNAEGAGFASARFEPSSLAIDDAGNNSFNNGFNDTIPGFTRTFLDPLFEHAAAGNYGLRFDSPLVDAGAPVDGIGPADRDAADKPRIAGRRIDVGAFEFPTARLVLFDQREAFLDLVPASLASDPYAPANRPAEPFVSGRISFAAVPPSSLFFADWAQADFSDDNDVELAINGNEDLDINSEAGAIHAFGIDFEDSGGGQTPSTFEVTGVRDGRALFRFSFATPDPERDFIGLWSSEPFDALRLREASAANENEFFGSVFTGVTPLPGLLFRNAFESP